MNIRWYLGARTGLALEEETEDGRIVDRCNLFF